ncbi:unnamed protein product, partial [Sphacelaria rigidula]
MYIKYSTVNTKASGGHGSVYIGIYEETAANVKLHTVQPYHQGCLRITVSLTLCTERFHVIIFPMESLHDAQHRLRAADPIGPAWSPHIELTFPPQVRVHGNSVL